MKFKLKTTYKPTGDQLKVSKQFFIMLVGFSQSGKSTLAKKIEKKFPAIFTRIDSDSIHDFLNKNYSVFQDDQTIKGKSFNLRQNVTAAIKKILIRELISHGQSVILDSCNLSKVNRQKILKLVKKLKKKIITIIIFVNISKSVLYANLLKADQKKKTGGEKPVWVDLHEKVQKDKIDKPNKNEAGYLLIYNYPKEKSVLKQLRKIILKNEI